MKKLEEKRRQWLDSHLAPYLADPSKRAMNGAVCCYKTPDGKKCIVGQDIPSKKYRGVMDEITNSSINCNDYVLDALPKRTKDLGINFLKAAQELHDGSSNWNHIGLTESGKRAYQSIIKNHCS